MAQWRKSDLSYKELGTTVGMHQVPWSNLALTLTA